jgi:hypothetical protein
METYCTLSNQSWAHLDQAPNDLYTTLFRDLSPTPFTQILGVLSKQAHFDSNIVMSDENS